MWKKKYFFLAAAWLSFFAGYLLFAGKLKASEGVAGAIAAASTVILFFFIYPQPGPRLLPLKWLALLLALPKAMIGESWLLLIALFRWRRSHRSCGNFIEYPYRIRKEDPFSAARRAFITYGVCFSPNSYLIDFDPENGVILIRQLVGDRLSESDDSFLELQ